MSLFREVPDVGCYTAGGHDFTIEFSYEFMFMALKFSLLCNRRNTLIDRCFFAMTRVQLMAALPANQGPIETFDSLTSIAANDNRYCQLESVSPIATNQNLARLPGGYNQS